MITSQQEESLQVKQTIVDGGTSIVIHMVYS